MRVSPISPEQARTSFLIRYRNLAQVMAPREVAA